MDTLPSSFPEFLTWIGSSAAIGAVLSWMMKHWSFFARQSSGLKVIMLFIPAALMGFASHFLIKYLPAGIVEGAEPYYQVLLNTIAILLLALGYHNTLGNRTTVHMTTYVDPTGTVRTAYSPAPVVVPPTPPLSTTPTVEQTEIKVTGAEPENRAEIVPPLFIDTGKG